MISKWVKTISGLCLSAFAGLSYAEYKLNLQEPQSKLAADIYDLHTAILVICTVIFVLVFGVMFYSIWAHRKSVGHKAANFHENHLVEIIWTIIPLFILVGMGWPATKAVLAMKDTRNPDMTIKVTAYQWKWEYEYLNEGVRFFSTLSTPRDQIEGAAPKGENYLLEVDNPVVVPVGAKVRLLLTANDVIHSWMIPALAVKQDAIPGFIRDAWFRAEKTGVYRGQCVELCGKDHGFMPIVLEVKSQADYEKWVADKKGSSAPKQDQVAAVAEKPAPVAADPNKKYSLDELKALGEKVYAAHCVACHQANGKGLPGTFPALDGGPVVNGPKAGHLEMVVKGSKKNPSMRGFTELSDLDIAAVVTFERNSWGNKKGDLVQPSEVKDLRK